MYNKAVGEWIGITLILYEELQQLLCFLHVNDVMFIIVRHKSTTNP